MDGTHLAATCDCRLGRSYNLGGGIRDNGVTVRLKLIVLRNSDEVCCAVRLASPLYSYKKESSLFFSCLKEHQV